MNFDLIVRISIFAADMLNILIFIVVHIWISTYSVDESRRLKLLLKHFVSTSSLNFWYFDEPQFFYPFPSRYEQSIKCIEQAMQRT